MGRGRRGKGGGFSGREDQYGDYQGSRGPDDFQTQKGQGGGGGARAGGGGGSAGSQSRHKAGHNLNFQRHVPKFLQQYAHMLGSGKQQDGNNEDGADEDAPVVVGGPLSKKRPGAFDGWSDEEEGEGRGRGKGGQDDIGDVEADALRRAMEENPELAAEFEGKLSERLNQAKAVEEKEKGNRAFAAKKYKEAIDSFTRCIELDPNGEVYWSNRSAAHAALDEWEAAARDAKQAVKLKPRWAKAHSRLAVAFYGLKLYSDAVESYKRALAIEPDDQALQKGLERAQMMELQQSQSRTHVFFKKQKLDAGGGGQAAAGKQDARDEQQPPRRDGSAAKDDGGGGGASGGGGGKGPPAAGKKGVLSFADDEEDDA